MAGVLEDHEEKMAIRFISIGVLRGALGARAPPGRRKNSVWA